MDATAMVCQQLTVSFDRLKKCVADLTDEEARRQLAGKLSPVIWQLGHVAVSDAQFAQRAGGSYAVPPHFANLFKMGSGGQADYPSLEEVSAVLSQAHRSLLAAAQEADYTKPLEGRSYSTVGELLVFAVQHRGYHIGKMASLRALLGKPILFGAPPAGAR